MDAELLPCPFCGSADIDESYALMGGPDGPHNAPGCNSCDAMADSVEKWNRRASPATSAQDEREAFEALISHYTSDLLCKRFTGDSHAALTAAFDAARARYAAPVAGTEAVAWQYRHPVETSGLWQLTSLREVADECAAEPDYEVRALGVIPPATDAVRSWRHVNDGDHSALGEGPDDDDGSGDADAEKT